MISSNNLKKLIVTQKDKDILDEINLKRDLFEDGMVWEAFVVSIRIWLPDNNDGVIDICIPVSEDNTFGFKDKWEGIVRKDSVGVYRLSDRGGNKDIPKHFYSPIEEKMLIPVSMGALIPYDQHLYGKGIICKIANMKAKEFRIVLEDVEIVSPYENARFLGMESDKALPKSYKKVIVKKVTDYKAIIDEGESEKVEFKSSARWDFKKNCTNKEIQKAVIKSIAGFLNSSGGFLFIGIDDNQNIIGIQNDLTTLKKRNIDGYRLFLSDLISEKIGKHFNSYITMEFPKINECFICVIKVGKSISEAFVMENDKNMFYIRTNNSTRELDSKETFEYILLHFKK